MLSAIASFLGLLGSLFSWFTGAQQRKIGAQTQALKDADATIKEANEGQLPVIALGLMPVTLIRVRERTPVVYNACLASTRSAQRRMTGRQCRKT